MPGLRGVMSAAALGCALTAGSVACGSGGGKKHVIIKAGPDASTSMTMVPDGSLERCVVDTSYLAKHRACGGDADCDLFTYQVRCCPDADSLTVAIAADDLEEVQACADSAPVVCACTDGLTRAEDGRVVGNETAAIARCVDQKCVSAVGTRACGSLATCSEDEICVTYQNVPGGFPPDSDSPDNKFLTFRCVANPCQGQLKCDCVQPICDARNDAERKCEIKRNAESDATCTAYQD